MGVPSAVVEWTCESIPKNFDDSTPPTYDMTCSQQVEPPSTGTVSLDAPQFEALVAFLAVMVMVLVVLLISSWGGRRG